MTSYVYVSWKDLCNSGLRQNRWMIPVSEEQLNERISLTPIPLRFYDSILLQCNVRSIALIMVLGDSRWT